jgi:hypothetical protein
MITKLRMWLALCSAWSFLLACSGVPETSPESETLVDLPDEQGGLVDADSMLGAEYDPADTWGEAADLESPSEPPNYISRDEAEEALRTAELKGLKEFPAEGLKAGSWIHRYYPVGDYVNHEPITSNFNHICFLAGWKGRIRDGNGNPYAYVGLRDTASAANEITVYKDTPIGLWVRCVPREAFTSPGGFLPYQQVRWWSWNSNGCDSVHGYTPFFGNQAMTISGFGYDFNHTYDKIWVDQAPSTSTANFINHAPRSPCQQVAFWTAIALHNDGNPAKFSGPNGVGTPSQAGKMFFEVKGGKQVQHDLGVNKNNECYFRYIAGNFASDDDYALLTQTSPAGAWALYAGTSSSGEVRVGVHCVPHAQ